MSADVVNPAAAAPGDPSSVEFIGLRYDALALDAAVAAIVRQANLKAPFEYVVTPSADHIVRLRQDEKRLAPLFHDAWLTLNDSRVLEMLAAWSGVTLPVAGGADIVTRLFAREIDPFEPVTIIGGDEELVFRLQSKFNLKDVRWRNPPPKLADNPAAIGKAAAFIAANPSRFVILAVGAPQQEMVARAALQRGDCKGVGVCAGSGLEYAAGVKRRAPDWAQAARLEWAYRLSREPGRLWGRYALGAPVLLRLWLEWRRTRSAG